MAGAKWTAIDGNRVRYVEGGRRAGPDLLLVSLSTGLASEETAWAIIIAAARVVAVDLSPGWGSRCPLGAMASFVVSAIDMFRLRRPHLVVPAVLGTAAHTLACDHRDEIESLIFDAEGGMAGQPAWPLLTLQPSPVMLPTLILDGDMPRPCRARILRAWIDGGFRSAACRNSGDGGPSSISPAAALPFPARARRLGANAAQSRIPMPTSQPASLPLRPLASGDRVPAFEMVDPLGGVLRSSDLLRAGAVLLTFYRGGWCPCCRADLLDLREAGPLFTTMNITVLGVFHELSAEGSARIRKVHGVGFTLVNDPDGRAAQAFGIRRPDEELSRIEQELGPELIVLREGQPWITPMQARYLLASDGFIRHAELVSDYRQRSNLAPWLSSAAVS